MPRISDYTDYKLALEVQVRDRVTRDATGLEVEKIHDHDIDFREECAQEDRAERSYEEKGYQLASGEW